ncbi:MAG: 50S ribosomal protein L21 [Actinomycetota bacterium]
MYAVIKAGGKQQKVKTGDVIEVELMHASGDTIELHPILVVDDDGKTHVGKEAQKSVVVAKLVGEQKGDKVKVMKYRPKTGYAKKQGHRQLMTLLEIEDIKLGGSRPAAKTAAAEEAPKKDPAAKEAPKKDPAAKEPAAKEPAAKEPAAKEPAAKPAPKKEPAAKAAPKSSKAES